MWQCPKVHILSQIGHSGDQKCAPPEKSAREIGIDAATFLAYSPIVSLYPLILEHCGSGGLSKSTDPPGFGEWQLGPFRIHAQ
jgi:hypothetical protein